MKIPGKLVSWFLLILVCQLATCGDSESSGDTQDQTVAEAVDTVPYELIDSLLAEPYEVRQTEKAFRPPAGFERIADSLLTPLRYEFQRAMGRQGFLLDQVFFGEAYGAAILVSTIQGLFIHVDTAMFFGGYTAGLKSKYGDENVSHEEYWLDSIYVRNYRVLDSMHVRFQLVCLSQFGRAAEVHYIIPHMSYARVAPFLNSSMVSMRYIGKHGIGADTPDSMSVGN